MFNFQPQLSGKLLNLRPMTEDDFEHLFAVAADPLIWELHDKKDRWQRPVFTQNIDDAFAEHGGLVAIERQSGEIAGFSRYSQLFVGPKEIEIGWTFLRRDLWGGTHNRDMKRIMLAHGLSSFPRVLFRVAADNARSRGAMEKLGGRLIDWQGEVEHSGKKHKYIAYEITREMFSNWD